MKEYPFFAMMARMKYIERWALMRNSVKENISEHSLEVAMIAHALGIIANEKFGKEIDLGKITLMGLYHDANEIITGDMPTPVKYYDEEIQKAYKKVEKSGKRYLVKSASGLYAALLPGNFAGTIRGRSLVASCKGGR